MFRSLGLLRNRDGVIEKFLEYMRCERNKSPRTVGEYGDDLRAFETYFTGMDSELTWETIDSDVIRDWMESMMDKGNTASSVNRRLSAVRSFFRYALAYGLVEKDPAHAIVAPKKKKPLPQFVKESEMDRLLDGVGMWDDSAEDLRARTIIIAFYETGMRLSELTGLDIGAVDMTQCQLKVTGKRNKQRIIPFGEELRKALETYMVQRLPAGGEALFADKWGQRLTNDKVRNIVRAHLAKVTTMKKKSPHVLRHSFATAMLNNGAGIESVRKLLGHESIATTEVYTHTTFEQLKKAYNEAHPRA